MTSSTVLIELINKCLFKVPMGDGSYGCATITGFALAGLCVGITMLFLGLIGLRWWNKDE